MLDSDLALLYGVEAKRLNEQIRRNKDRFPEDFMFELTTEEWNSLRSQIATSSTGRGGRTYLPHVFTEQGVAMLSSVLNSPQAIQVNIQIIRIFTKLRQFLVDNTEIRLEIEQIKASIEKLGKIVHNQDKNMEVVFQYLDELAADKKTESIPSERKRIGYEIGKVK